MHSHLRIPLVKDVLAPFFAEYALHVVVGDHIDLQGYNQFPCHLKIKGNPRRPVVLIPPTPRGELLIDFEIELPFAAVYVESSGLTVHLVEDLGYRIDVDREPKRDGELREVWKCCSRQVTKRPQTNTPMRLMP